MSAVRAIPEGYHSITPAIVCKGAARAIEFYKEVFQAKEIMRMSGPGGTIGHAELQIGDSRIMLNDEFPGMANAPGPLRLPAILSSSIPMMWTLCSSGPSRPAPKSRCPCKTNSGATAMARSAIPSDTSGVSRNMSKTLPPRRWRAARMPLWRK
jgi:Glyoxalase/Bleomycin resistance protein/Dioxygenase superfamily